jgi:hypothetical protein
MRVSLSVLLALSASTIAAAGLDLITSEPLPRRDTAVGGMRFEKLDPSRTGVDFEHRWTPPAKYASKLDNAVAGGGVAIGDYDGDGNPDLFLTRPFGGGRLYRNLGEMRFEDVSESAGVNDDKWATGATFADIDNDGDLDLYVCGYDCANRLYFNRGDGTFDEQAKIAGLGFRGGSVMMSFADCDRDGDLDGYLLTNRLTPDAPIPDLQERLYNGAKRVRGRWVVPQDLREIIGIIEKKDGTTVAINAGQFDHLYENNGDGTFKDVTRKAGIAGADLGLSATWWDYDSDGWPDLYVANDFFGPDYLYRNTGKSGGATFENVISRVLPHTPWFSMGSDSADINNDGLPDFMASDMASTTHFKQKLTMGDMETSGWFLTLPTPRQYMRNAVYLNSGTDRFMEVAFLTGLANTDWTWSLKFGDYDNDGRVDLFVSNGMTRYWFNSDLYAQRSDSFEEDFERIWRHQPPRAEPNLAFRNAGDLAFENVGPAWGLDEVGVSFGAATGDLDGDGDLDLVVNNFGGPASIYRNLTPTGHRVKLRLHGKDSNSWGIGATVRIEHDGVVQVRYLTLSRGFMSSDEPLVHFGLGESDRADRMTIHWPHGRTQTFTDLEADRFYQVREPIEPDPVVSVVDPAPTHFERFEGIGRMRHREAPFGDFRRQRLLPNRLSRLGPGMASADVDGDGDEDLFLGGAAKQAGRISFNDGRGGFSPGPERPFSGDAACEDMGVLFFDADSDGDADLYVVSGGVEAKPGDDRYLDRLYLNDGSGGFEKAPDDTLPDLRESGGVAVCADYDHDGDLDLFVGGRVVPGKYPLPASGRLLRNDGARFQVDADGAPTEFEELGLITGALWSDVDDDGWTDLLITLEWGPVRWFRNDEGTLVDQTGEANLGEITGWFNGISGRDVDGDGDIDYVVANFGLNTKYHASVDHPATLFYGDFMDRGYSCVVEATFEDEMLYPVRGRSCSINAMPSLIEHFPTFEKFAGAELDGIYSAEKLSDAYRVEANTLASILLVNDGEGHFQVQDLPRLAQISPAFGVALSEFDGRPAPDLVLAQNFFGPQRETGRMDGGLGLFLAGNDEGDAFSFRPVWPHKSGIVVPGDATSLVTTDLNGDDRLDFVMGVNNGNAVAYVNRGENAADTLTVRLAGGHGNPTAIGARVTVVLADETSQTAEVYGGSGYLSQSSAALVFGLGETGRVERIRVRWPDGESTSHTPNPGATRITVSRK